MVMDKPNEPLTLTDLIARLEAAPKGSRELDEDIDWLVDSSKRWTNRAACYEWPHYRKAPPFSRSLDAAMTLVPKGYDWRLEVPGFLSHGKPRAALTDNLLAQRWPFQSEAATPALALSAAALKAQGYE